MQNGEDFFWLQKSILLHGDRAFFSSSDSHQPAVNNEPRDDRVSLKEGMESNEGLSMTPSRLRAQHRFNVKLGLSQSAVVRLDGLGVKEGMITGGAVQSTHLLVSRQHCISVCKMGMN